VLDVIERRLEEGLALVEEDFHLEERLETASLLGASAASRFAPSSGSGSIWWRATRPGTWTSCST